MFPTPICKTTATTTMPICHHGCFPCFFWCIVMQQTSMKLQRPWQQLHSPSFSLNFRPVDERPEDVELSLETKNEYRRQNVAPACDLRRKRLHYFFFHVDENDKKDEKDDASHISESHIKLQIEPYLLRLLLKFLHTPTRMCYHYGANRAFNPGSSIVSHSIRKRINV